MKAQALHPRFLPIALSLGSFAEPSHGLQRSPDATPEGSIFSCQARESEAMGDAMK